MKKSIKRFLNPRDPKSLWRGEKISSTLRTITITIVIIIAIIVFVPLIVYGLYSTGWIIRDIISSTKYDLNGCPEGTIPISQIHCRDHKGSIQERSLYQDDSDIFQKIAGVILAIIILGLIGGSLFLIIIVLTDIYRHFRELLVEAEARLVEITVDELK